MILTPKVSIEWHNKTSNRLEEQDNSEAKGVIYSFYSWGPAM